MWCGRGVVWCGCGVGDACRFAAAEILDQGGLGLQQGLLSLWAFPTYIYWCGFLADSTANTFICLAFFLFRAFFLGEIYVRKIFV